MNKKIVTMATSLAIGGTLLFGAAFANASQLSGYEAYKNALKDTKNLKNGTIEFKVSMADNGSSLLNLSSNVKLNENSNAMSSVTTVKTGDTTKTFSSYEQDGKNVSKSSDSDQYMVRQDRHKDSNEAAKVQDPAVEKSMEVVIDTLAGSMQNKVVTTDGTDGSKSVAIDLSENDVTPLVNALTSMAFAAENNKGFHNEKIDKNGEKDLKDVIPQLKSDIKVESVDSTGSISKDDIITSQTAKIVVSGKDAQGTQHELTLNIDLNLSDINSTTPDKIDLTGKNVKTMAFDKMRQR